ncbi:O-antigen ligase family protein [Sphingobacterium sp. E70]|uniref:O-antigen ligase family protein n=1 Tax=Sphingobacterium sp. E70 TaxID=2853439 RepID=UPI00211D0D48|nr:O-antigen ligase family protein [Sphingobacterium sp. E70]ULT28280.1 O-antigen ligase family protein [Sphingobacterium sp. E70]
MFFSNLALFYAFRKRLIKLNILIAVGILFFICVILSISRLGQLLFLIFYAIEFGRYINIFSLKGAIKSLFVLPVVLALVYILSTMSIGGFNIGARFISAFEVEADLSTIERYGSSQALFNLLKDKSLLLGVGMYNFQYYIKDYLPAYMDVLYYPRGASPASFNFVLQMIVELGLILFLIYMLLTCLILQRTANSFIRFWYFYLFLFSLSFQTLNFSIPF